jgi:hypothetical protein
MMSDYYLVCLKNRDPNKILAKAIRDIEGIEFNHVEILKVYDTNEVVSYGAVSYGAVSPMSRWCTLDELNKHYEIIEKIPLKLAVTDATATILLASAMGKPYSQLQIVLICAKLLFQKAINWLPYVKLNLDHFLICTELAGNFMDSACNYKIDISTETLTLKECVAIAKKALLTDTKTQ